MIKLAGLLFALILSSCASLPTPEEMKKATENYSLPKTAHNEKALIYVVRPSGLGTLVRFNVYLDDKEDSSEMGYNRGGQYIHFYTTPGPHKILSLAENWAEVNINPKAGEILFIKQNPELGIIMSRNNIHAIEELEGKYHVKSLTIGTVKQEDKKIVENLSRN